MRFRTLLVHRCSLLTQGTVTGVDEYGRDIVQSIVHANVPCRFDEVRQRASSGDTGTDFIYENTLFFSDLYSIDLETKIENITDKEGNPVLPGSFSVKNILPVYKRSRLHHYEIKVQRV